MVDMNSSGLQTAGQKLSAKFPDIVVLTQALDISHPGAMDSAVSSILSDPPFGRLDYCVNCAGINGVNKNHPPTNTTETTVEYFDLINGINYRGTWMANRAYLNAMMKQEPLPSHDGIAGREQRGAIVNLSSGLGVISMPKNRICSSPLPSPSPSNHILAVYSASKAAIIALTRSDAVDYSPHKIRINCVCPGLIDTPMTHAMGDDPAAMQWVVEQTPLKRLGKPEEIADTCVFLCSTRASWIQGQSVIADGGIVLM